MHSAESICDRMHMLQETFRLQIVTRIYLSRFGFLYLLSLFYHHLSFQIPHYAHIADPLYHLLRKGKKFEWKPEHTKAMKKLKKKLRRAEALKMPSYDRPIIVTVDTSPTGIRWVINQADSDGSRYPIRFGAKVLNERQRGRNLDDREDATRS